MSRDGASAKTARQARRRPGENPQVTRTKKHILRSTRELMIEKGVRAVTIDAVSARSGSSRSTIYRHWATIDDLLFSAFSGLVGEPFASPDTGDFKKDLLLINQKYVSAVGESVWVRILPSFIEISQNDAHCAALLAQLVANMRRSSLDILRKAQVEGHLSKHAKLDWIVDVISGPTTYRTLLSKAPVDESGYLEYLIEAATSPYQVNS